MSKKPKTILLSNGYSVPYSPAKRSTVRATGEWADGWAACQAKCIEILEAHLKTYIAPEARLSQTEPDLLLIDVAALEEIKRL